MRNRNWVVAGVLVLAVIAGGILFGHGRTGGSGRPRVLFGSQVQKPAAASRLIYTNAWVASSGRQSIGVYAGRQTSDRHDGLFVILRRSGGRRRLATVAVHGSGIVTLLRPAAPATEQAAFSATLHFVTANGGTGTLSLSGDSMSLSG